MTTFSLQQGRQPGESQVQQFERFYALIRAQYLTKDVTPREFVQFVVQIRRRLAPGFRGPGFRQALDLAAAVDRLPQHARSSRFVVNEIALLIDEEIFQRDL